MKLELSRKDYRLLLDILQLARWVVTSYRETDAPETAEFHDFEQRVLGQASEMGCEEMVAFDDETGLQFPAWDLFADSAFGPLLEQFEDEVFWDQLGERLAHRDLVIQEGEESVRNLDPDAFFQKMDEKKEYYMEEFDEHGLDRLVIDEWATKNQTRH